jgi:hypothetical protein
MAGEIEHRAALVRDDRDMQAGVSANHLKPPIRATRGQP